jgi:hypothetical protein
MATVREALLHPLRYRFRKDRATCPIKVHIRPVLAGVLAFLCITDPPPLVGPFVFQRQPVPDEVRYAFHPCCWM